MMAALRRQVEEPGEAFESPPESAAAHLEAIAKGINDVDTLIQGLLSKVPPSKPWQRQLLVQLAAADRHVEILRLAIYLEHSDSEIREAAAPLRHTLQAAHAQIAGGRADGGTKATMQVATHLARLVCALLAG